MRRAAISRSVTWVVLAVALLLLIYLSLLALDPSAAHWLPPWLRWFGDPGSWPTIALVVAVLAALSTLGFRSGGSHRLMTVPLGPQTWTAPEPKFLVGQTGDSGAG